VLVPGVAAVVQWLLKELVHRRAPGDDAPASALAFLSGHATGAWAVAVTAALVAAVALPPSRTRRVVIGGALLGALAVSVARVVAGTHYTTDVVAGALLGSSIALIGAAIVSDAP
jgi:undecaprenyl-diphosphatase